MFLVGQGLYGKIKFVDGIIPQYDRAYLIVEVLTDSVGVLNVSSIAGKEHKLLFPTNKLINKHYPPFLRRSFVKLDSLVYITLAEASNARILDNGTPLDQAELYSILKAAKDVTNASGPMK